MRKTRQQIESERIINIGEYEAFVRKARTNMEWLKNALERKDYETSIHLAEQIDLTLHQMEAHEFQIERRTVIVNNLCEHQ